MIESIELRNFQCHKLLDLKLDPYVTVLVGDNGVGKSSVIRALEWWALNQWDGRADQMIRWGEKEASVTAVFDGGKIARIKGPAGNLYQLNDLEPFEAVGTKVPTAVAKLINLSDDNFQRQLDPAFWFHLTSGQVAKSLNKIVSLTDIDNSLDEMSRELRQAREDVKSTEQRISEARNIKESLDWTKDANAKLQEIEDQETKMVEIKATAAALTSKANALARWIKIRQRASCVILAGQKVVETGQEFSTCSVNLRSIRSLTESITTEKEKTCKLTDQLDRAMKKLTKIAGSLCPSCQGTGRVNKS